MIRMHRYEDDRDGLAAFCDVCGEQITENAYVVWDGNAPRNWLVIHQAKCDPGSPIYTDSMPLDIELIYLANSTACDLDSARETLGDIEGLS